MKHDLNASKMYMKFILFAKSRNGYYCLDIDSDTVKYG